MKSPIKKLMLVTTLMLMGASVAGAQAGDLEKTFQREYAFLLAQKEALQGQIRDQQKSHQAEMKKLLAEVKGLEGEVARRGVSNDVLFEDMQKLEKERRERAAREGSLLSTWKKAQKNLDEVEALLRFEAPEKREPVAPDNLNLAAFADLRRRSVEVLRASTQVSEQKGVYLSAEGRLIEGQLVRLGRVGAYGLNQGESHLLGPDGKGRLSVVEPDPQKASLHWLDSTQASGRLLPVFLFESLTEKAVLKKPATWADRLADSIPILLLAALFAMVGGLFFVLARE